MWACRQERRQSAVLQARTYLKTVQDPGLQKLYYSGHRASWEGSGQVEVQHQSRGLPRMLLAAGRLFSQGAHHGMRELAGGSPAGAKLVIQHRLEYNASSHRQQYMS